MRLNTVSPATGSRTTRLRVGRGIGSGHGKTCGRGHKGQKARAGGYHKVGFEGGQMPLQRRLPKRGFRSAFSARCAEVRLHELIGLSAKVIDLPALIAAGVVPAKTLKAKIIASGVLLEPVKISGIAVTRGARIAIEQAGGIIES